jgi:hypothetical protein
MNSEEFDRFNWGWVLHVQVIRDIQLSYALRLIITIAI